MICFDVRIIKISALEADLCFHVSLPLGNTHEMSPTIGNVTHAPYRVIEQGLHQSKHVFVNKLCPGQLLKVDKKN